MNSRDQANEIDGLPPPSADFGDSSVAVDEEDDRNQIEIDEDEQDPEDPNPDPDLEEPGQQDEAPGHSGKLFLRRDGILNQQQPGRDGSKQLKARQRRKFKRLNKLHSSPLMKQQQTTGLPLSSGGDGGTYPGAGNATAKAPILHSNYLGRLKENERLVELRPKLLILNRVEVCDVELTPADSNGHSNNNLAMSADNLPFIVSWIDRIQGEALLEARSEDLMNCERQRNYTFRMRAIGCNGLQSNEALVSVVLDDVNEFSPEFERLLYSTSLDIDSGAELILMGGQQAPDPILLQVQARDQDCSLDFGAICRYELLSTQSELKVADFLAIDLSGRIRLTNGSSLIAHLKAAESAVGANGADKPQQVTFLVIAYDCGNKKSQIPATIQLNLNKLCRPSLKDVDTLITYRPGSGEVSPFLHAQLDMCGLKCHRPDISIALKLEQESPLFDNNRTTINNKSKFHCDRDSYSMLSKRRLCGARSKAIELLPPYGVQSKWVHSLHKPNGVPQDTKHGVERSAPDEAPLRARVWPEESPDSDLDSYALDGSYGRLTDKFNELISAGQSAATSLAGSSLADSGEPSSAGQLRSSLLNGKRSQGSDSRSPLISSSANEAARKRADSIKRRGRSATAPRSSRSHQFEHASIYRDQVFKFDGVSSALMIPKSILNEIRSERAAKSSADNATSRPVDSALFGARHTISFWMRHAPFKFNAATEAMPSSLFAHETGNETNGQQMGGEESGPGQAAKPSASELEELSRHVKEHLLCASLEPSVVSQTRPPRRYSGSRRDESVDNLESAPPDHEQERRRHHHHQQQQPKAQAKHHSILNQHHHSHRGRHYFYSLFVRNCKLVLIMRRQQYLKNETDSGPARADVDLNSMGAISDNNEDDYRPSEWHWTFPEQANKVCDNKWHLYTINVMDEQSVVELYVDGQQFAESYDNLMIVDDLPIKIDLSAMNSREGEGGSGDSTESELNGANLANDANDNSEEMAEPQPGQSRASDDDDRSLGTLLTLGACYDSHKQTMFGHFKGSLSGLVVLVEENDNSQVIECLGECSESLVSKSTSSQPTMQHDQQLLHLTSDARLANSKVDSNSLVLYQESQSKVLLTGHDFLDIEETLSQIAYVNQRQLPSIGKRVVDVDTRIECQQHSATEQSERFEHKLRIEILVQPSKTLPAIQISGLSNLAREYSSFIQGVRVFSTIGLRIKKIQLAAHHHVAPREQHLNISRSSKLSMGERINEDLGNLDYIEDSTSNGRKSFEETATSKQFSSNQQVHLVQDLHNYRKRIEACNVKVYPPLNGLHESLIVPEIELKKLSLYHRSSLSGLLIYGLDLADNYEKLLHMIVYKNQKPAYYLERVFKLTCSDMNGRLVSNEYSQTVTIIHNSAEQPKRLVVNQQLDEDVERDQSKLTRFAALRKSEAPHLTLNDEHVTILQTLGDNSYFPNGDTSMTYSTKMDRLATAFLVFVVSLIVLMLVIALTNLRSGGEVKDRHPCSAPSRGRSVNNLKGTSSLRAMTVDANTGKTEYFYEDDEIGADESGSSSSSSSDDEEDEQFANSCDEADDELIHNAGQEELRSVVSCQQSYCRVSSPTSNLRGNNVWREGSDDEDDGCDESTTNIVMNPMLHATNKSGQSSGLVKTFVTEQRPNKRGAITKPAQTIITYHLPELEQPTSGLAMLPLDEVMSSSSEESEDEISDAVRRASSSASRKRGRRQQQQMINDDDDDEEEFSSSSSTADQYEIYHQHQHQYQHEPAYFHHDCLKRRQQLPTAGAVCPFHRHHSQQHLHALHHMHHVHDHNDSEAETTS